MAPPSEKKKKKKSVLMANTFAFVNYVSQIPGVDSPEN